MPFGGGKDELVVIDREYLLKIEPTATCRLELTHTYVTNIRAILSFQFVFQGKVFPQWGVHHGLV